MGINPQHHFMSSLAINQGIILHQQEGWNVFFKNYHGGLTKRMEASVNWSNRKSSARIPGSIWDWNCSKLHNLRQTFLSCVKGWHLLSSKHFLITSVNVFKFKDLTFFLKKSPIYCTEREGRPWFKDLTDVKYKLTVLHILTNLFDMRTHLGWKQILNLGNNATNTVKRVIEVSTSTLISNHEPVVRHSMDWGIRSLFR